MRDDRVRLGLLYPGGGAEQDYYLFGEAVQDRVRMFLVGTRVGGGGNDDHSVAALLRTAAIENLTEATRRLSLVRPDAVMWACTSGSFIVGRRGAERQAEAMSEIAKVPASSTSLAFARALSMLGLRRVAVLAPYPEPASRAFVAFLGEWGIEVDGFLWLDAPNGFDSALIPAETILRAARETDRRGAEALLIPDTALSTLSIVDELERGLGKFVLTANQVTIWEGLRLAGSSFTVAGHGRLLATAPSAMLR
jgi:maleate cis-trans isomerase